MSAALSPAVRKALVIALAGCSVLGVPALAAAAKEESALSDEPLPLQVDKAPARPQPIELGPPFLGTGVIGPGFEMPGGAVWQPQLLLWGTLRTAVQSFDREGDSNTRISEWRNRLDIFGEVEVSPTERVVAGIRPLDNDREFTGCGWEPGDDKCQEHLSGQLEILFLEANFGELFPNLDPDDSRALDIEFSVGRQPLLFQDGILIDDRIDSIAITRNNINLPGTSNTRLTGLVGLSNIGRADNREDNAATLGALLIETDVPWSTINLDVVYIDSDDEAGSSVHTGLSFIQRIRHLNTTFRALYSNNFDGRSDQASEGALFFGEVSYVPSYTHDNVYTNLFVGVDEYSSAARAGDAGGPLGRTGLLFAAVGLGAYGSPLSRDLKDVVGGVIGRQFFFSNNRRWLVLEGGGKLSWHDDSPSAVAAGMSFQQAIGQRVIARLDGFIGHEEDADLGWGGRMELLLKF